MLFNTFDSTSLKTPYPLSLTTILLLQNSPFRQSILFIYLYCFLFLLLQDVTLQWFSLQCSCNENPSPWSLRNSNISRGFQKSKMHCSNMHWGSFDSLALLLPPAITHSAYLWNSTSELGSWSLKVSDGRKLQCCFSIGSISHFSATPTSLCTAASQQVAWPRWRTK